VASLPGLDFIVNKTAWRETRFVDTELPQDLADGQVLFRVDRFAFTANNITYAMAGDMLGYWRFFPTEEGWGRIPAMGFGDVIASRHDAVAVGTRCFGFFPMSKHLLIEPASASSGSIVDGVANRQGLAAAYNQYSPVLHDGLYAADKEDELILMRGLFMTSFLAEDFLAESDLYGAESVLISSASSKTSIAMAFVVAKKGQARAIGLTSAANREFVKRTGYYDEVISYDEIGSLPADVPTVYVDMAGNTKVSRGVHEHFGANLKFSQRIGGTHWDAGGDDADIVGPDREFFFAPSQIQKRIADWGAQGFQQRLGKSWAEFRDASASWLQVERGYGRDAVERVFAATLAGQARPDQGYVLSLWDDEESASGR
jgi:NADPH:quinone reductase-like Zn-dependent oxidoreductase